MLPPGQDFYRTIIDGDLEEWARKSVFSSKYLSTKSEEDNSDQRLLHRCRASVIMPATIPVRAGILSVSSAKGGSLFTHLVIGTWMRRLVGSCVLNRYFAITRIIAFGAVSTFLI